MAGRDRSENEQAELTVADRLWRRVPGAVSRSLLDGVAVLSPRGREVLVLSGLAAHVWDELSDPASLVGIVRSLSVEETPGVAEPEALVLDVLLDLEDRGVLEAS